MTLQVKETIWRDITFKDGTTEEQIIDYIKENGEDNIYMMLLFMRMINCQKKPPTQYTLNSDKMVLKQLC
jgi:hypothetical protein